MRPHQSQCDEGTNTPEQSRIRVLLMASSMRGGGSEHQTALLAEHLDRDRFDVHLYLTHPDGDRMASLPSDVRVHSGLSRAERPTDAKDSGEPSALIRRMPGLALRRQAVDLCRLVEDLGIDVIYDRTFHMTLIAGHPVARHGVPRVSTIVSPPDLALPTVEQRFISLKRRRLAKAYQSSQCVVAVSQAAADAASRYYELDPDRISVIRNPVDVDAIVSSAQHAAMPARSRERSAPVRLVCVGRMSREKGQADLLNAFIELAGRHDVAPMQLRFIGDGPDRTNLERIWSQASSGHRLRPEHDVTFAGVRSPATPEIAAADVLVLPSHFEGLPNVVLEAFALRRPVIAARSGGTVELQHRDDQPTCYWAPPGDSVGLLNAIRRCLDDREHWPNRVENAWRLLQRRHRMDTAIGRIESRLILATGDRCNRQRC